MAPFEFLGIPHRSTTYWPDSLPDCATTLRFCGGPGTEEKITCIIGIAYYKQYTAMIEIIIKYSH